MAVVEYVEDMYKFYKETEQEDGRVGDYMNLQPNINAKMRAILVDWLIEVHRKFELMPESIYVSCFIVFTLDDTMSLFRMFHLVGVGS